MFSALAALLVTFYSKSNVDFDNSPRDTDEKFKNVEQNKEGNPLVFDQQEAVRASRPDPSPADPEETDDQWQRKFTFNGEELPEGLFVNPLPDPTLVARPVSFPESSEADRPIVGNELDSYRLGLDGGSFRGI